MRTSDWMLLVTWLFKTNQSILFHCSVVTPIQNMFMTLTAEVGSSWTQKSCKKCCNQNTASNGFEPPEGTTNKVRSYCWPKNNVFIWLIVIFLRGSSQSACLACIELWLQSLQSVPFIRKMNESKNKSLKLMIFKKNCKTI